MTDDFFDVQKIKAQYELWFGLDDVPDRVQNAVQQSLYMRIAVAELDIKTQQLQKLTDIEKMLEDGLSSVCERIESLQEEFKKEENRGARNHIPEDVAHAIEYRLVPAIERMRG